MMHSSAYFNPNKAFFVIFDRWGMGDRPSKQETLSQCCINVDPPSLSLVQHKGNIGSTSCVCWGMLSES